MRSPSIRSPEGGLGGGAAVPDQRALEQEAQARGEEALDATYRAAYDEEDEPVDFEFAGPVCDGPCNTCIVREVLHAAWEPMMDLARREAADEAA